MISNFQSQRLRRLFRFGAVFVLSGTALVLLLLLLGRASPVLANGGGCDPRTINEPGNNGCLTLTALPVSGTITIDGQAVEWTNAPSKTLAGDFSATVWFQTQNISNNLYLFITLIDTESPGDYVQLKFDPRHNHGDETDDVVLTINRSDTGHSSSIDPGWTPPSDQLAVISSSTSWTVEIKVNASDLGRPDLPPILGFAIEGFDDINTTSWANPSTPTDWANLKTRYPIEYMVVLDQSGSMLSQNKWDDAKKATNLLADTLAALADPMYFDDRLGVVTFAWDCSGADKTVTVPPGLAPISTTFPADFAGVLTMPLHNNCTPIGRGMRETFTQLGTSPEVTQRVGLLLSDGLHNRPPGEVPLTHTAAHLGYDPCPTSTYTNWSCEPGTGVSVVKINSVAFGTDWGVDTLLLQNIANRFSGAFAPHYAIVLTSTALQEIFITNLEELYQANLVASIPGPFPVTSGNHRLVVIQSWITATNATSFTLSNSGTIVNCDSSKLDTTSGYAICVVNNPSSGPAYTATSVVGGATPPDGQFVLVDLSLRARFGIDRKIHGTGKEIILTADLNEKGVPITEAAGYTVMATVYVARPGEGLGHFLSTHDPHDCTPLAGPSLPEPGTDPQGECLFTFGSGLPTTVSQGGDPLPPLFNLAGQMLEVCRKEEGLERVNEPDLILLDDGENGDAQAGDGIYSGRIVPEYEGSYTFRFNVEGTTPTGEKFARTKLMAQYVRLEVDPAHSDTGSRVWWQGKKSVIEEFYIIPRDAYGQHLGPGHADQVRFAAPYGEWISPVHDYGNGIYARLLKYDKGQKPPVEYIVQGKSVISPDCRVIILLIVILLILIVSWVLLRKLRMRREVVSQSAVEGRFSEHDNE